MREYPLCADCGAPMRPKESSEIEAPGTVSHEARGLCRRDYTKHRKNGTLDAFMPRQRYVRIAGTPEDDLPDRQEHNIATFASYIRARRARGLPDDGTLRKCWPLDGRL